MTVEVSDAPEAKRYEARVDGESTMAGVAQYIRTPELVAFVHTEVGAEYEGRGVGSALARTALDEARREPASAGHLPLLRGLDQPAPRLPGPAVPVPQQGQ
ncbi:hypothetical protein GCM10022245_00950 [Streptomyces mayteni]